MVGLSQPEMPELSDETRIAQRKRVPQSTVPLQWVRFEGPIEQVECWEHPGNLESYRWTWRVPKNEVFNLDAHREGLLDGEVSAVDACPACLEAWAEEGDEE